LPNRRKETTKDIAMTCEDERANSDVAKEVLRLKDDDQEPLDTHLARIKDSARLFEVWAKGGPVVPMTSARLIEG
jgi:hypothetical protein